MREGVREGGEREGGEREGGRGRDGGSVSCEVQEEVEPNVTNRSHSFQYSFHFAIIFNTGIHIHVGKQASWYVNKQK